MVLSQRACGPYDAYDADLLKWELRWRFRGVYSVYHSCTLSFAYQAQASSCWPPDRSCVEARHSGEQITPKLTQQWLTDQGIHVFDGEGMLYLHTVDD